ncbi:MAG TPA: hypothetical protein VMV95_02500 [Bacillota bacterium]|nr:hypothetical protein [Bacillota bacterium]
MLKAGMTKSEIEGELAGKGDFVQIDSLTNFLNEPLSMGIKKFVFLKLAELYEKTSMLKEAAKNYNNAAMVSIPFSEKMKYFVKEAELYISAGDFEKAEGAQKKAISEANSIEREEIYFTIKEFYKKEAETYEKNLKRAHAARVYEKLLEIRISDLERKEIREKLMGIYDKLGKTKEYLILKKGL